MAARKKAEARKSKRAVIYTRVSTMTQVEEGHSLAAQEDTCRRYCEAQGLEVVQVYTDAGQSAMKDRPQFERMLEYVLSDGISHVVATRIDRIGRSVKQLTDVIDKLEEAGVYIALVDQQIDTSTSMGRFIRVILSGLAEMEGEMIRERTKVGLDAARAKGIKLGRPSGVSDEVRGIITALQEQGYGWTAIAKYLNEKGYPTSRGEGPWYPSTVRAFATKDWG